MTTKSNIGIALVLICVALALVFANKFLQEDNAYPVEDMFLDDLYASLVAGQAGGVDDLFRELDIQQEMWLPILPPGDGDYNCSAGIIPYDPTTFPKAFNAGLIPHECAPALSAYRIIIREDETPDGRRWREIINAKGKVLEWIWMPEDYDPYAYIKAKYPHLFKEDETKVSAYVAWLKMVYDPARVVVAVDLLPESEIISYVWAQSLRPERLAALEDGDDGGGMMTCGWDGGSVTCLQFVAVAPGDNKLEFTLAYPDDYTNDLCLVGCTNLPNQNWTLLSITNVDLSTNCIIMTDDGTPEIWRLFAVYNADHDGDGDGVPDGEEIFLEKTDPDDPHDPANIKGVVTYDTYSGGQTGPIYAVAVTSSNSWGTNQCDILTTTGAYHIVKIPGGSNYWMRAFRDSDGTGSRGTYEACGRYTNSPVFVTGQVTSIDIVMADPDSDGDGLGDWWEWKFFPDLAYSSGNSDPDVDKLMNLYEYHAGTDPTDSSDTDGDGMSDDWERYYGFDRYDPNDANEDADEDGFTNLEEYNAGTDPTDALSYPSNGHYVATNGVDAAGYGSYTNPYATIGYAVNAALDDDYVIILPGLHTGAGNREVDFGTKDLTISGLCNWETNTIIDCQSAGRAFQIQNGQTNAVLRHFTIRGAQESSPGGAITISGATVRLKSMILSGNKTISASGGALYGTACRLEIEDCMFLANEAGQGSGGAVYVSGETSRISRCVFNANTGFYGTAIYADAPLLIDHSRIISNYNKYWAGGAIESHERLTIEHSLFMENTGGSVCGAIRSFTGHLTLLNCTVLDNDQSEGSSVVRLSSNTAGITNCIIQCEEGETISGGTWGAAYCCLSGSPTPGSGNINDDPLFAPDGWHLTIVSPCWNAGTNLAGFMSETDLIGAPRVGCAVVDMGAHELQADRYVDLHNAQPESPYDSWIKAATNIQDAIDACDPYDIVIVSNGIYDVGSHAISGSGPCRVVLTNCVGVRSVNGTEVTQIVGAGPRGADAVRCAYVGTNCLLQGFALASGYTLTTGGSLAQDGGGAWCKGSALLSGCRVVSCSARYGGGVWNGRVDNSLIGGNSAQSGAGTAQSLVWDSVIESNAAVVNGGGVWTGEVHDCSLLRNSAQDGGGAYGALVAGSLISGNSASAGGGTHSCIVRDSTIQSNTATANGGGVYGGTVADSSICGNSASSGAGACDSFVEVSLLRDNSSTGAGGGAYGGTLRSCLIISNFATFGGGVCSGIVQNCTISDNSASQGGGGNYAGSLMNSIVYYNSPSNWSGGTYTNCCTIPLPPGLSCSTVPPGFVHRNAGDYSLSLGSPCIDAGRFASWMEGSTDLNGAPRVMMFSPDIGAYEHCPFPSAFVQVLDKSGSMRGGDINLAKDQMQRNIDGFEEHNWLGVIAFDSSASIVWPTACLGTESMKSSAKTAIDGVYANGDTFVDAGLAAAVDEFNAITNTVSTRKIVVWTDASANNKTLDNPYIPLDVSMNGVCSYSGWQQSYLSWIAQRRRGAYLAEPTAAGLLGLADLDLLYCCETNVSANVTNVHEAVVDSRLNAIWIRLLQNTNDTPGAEFIVKYPDGTVVTTNDVNADYAEYQGGLLFKVNDPTSGVWSIFVCSASVSDDYVVAIQGAGGLPTRFALSSSQFATTASVQVLVQTDPHATSVVVYATNVWGSGGDVAFELYDDGLNTDGVAGDGLYGGQFSNATQNLGSWRMQASVWGRGSPWNDGGLFHRMAEASIYMKSGEPLAVATNVTASQNKTNRITISWDGVYNIWYEVQRGNYSSNMLHNSILVASSNVCSVIDTNVLANMPYYYRVRAFGYDYPDSVFSEIVTGLAVSE